MNEERQVLSRGLMWLGSATAASRIIDALGLVLVLRFLSREEIGVATLAWSVTVFVECFNGLGIGTATLQHRDLSETQISSAFWYALGIGLVLTLSVSGAAPWIASTYGTAQLAPMIRVASLKLLFVGLAAVPLALIGRAMRYKAMGAITSFATLTSALVTLALAALGYGAWAPLLGNLTNGLAQLVGAYALSPSFSRRVYDWTALKPVARTGFYVSSSVAVVQLSRNVDYLLLGRLGGMQVLGGYRVAFDLAMAPSIAILQVGNRTALPVYAKLGKEPEKLFEAWLWTLRTVTLMVVPVLILVAFDGELLLNLLGKSGWPHADTTMRLLSVAALFRGLAETFPSLYVASGRAQLSLLHSAVNLALVTGCIVLGLITFRGLDQVLVVAAAWLVATALLVAFSLTAARSVLPVRFGPLGRALYGPLLVTSATCLVLAAARAFLPGVAALAVATDGVLLLVSYAAALRVVMGVRLGAISSRSDAAP